MPNESILINSTSIRKSMLNNLIESSNNEEKKNHIMKVIKLY